jgi:hypothetical protein
VGVTVVTFMTRRAVVVTVAALVAVAGPVLGAAPAATGATATGSVSGLVIEPPVQGASGGLAGAAVRVWALNPAPVGPSYFCMLHGVSSPWLGTRGGATSGPGGAFTVSGLAPGTYYLQVLPDAGLSSAYYYGRWYGGLAELATATNALGSTCPAGQKSFTVTAGHDTVLPPITLTTGGVVTGAVAPFASSVDRTTLGTEFTQGTTHVAYGNIDATTLQARSPVLPPGTYTELVYGQDTALESVSALAAGVVVTGGATTVRDIGPGRLAPSPRLRLWGTGAVGHRLTVSSPTWSPRKPQSVRYYWGLAAGSTRSCDFPVTTRATTSIVVPASCLGLGIQVYVDVSADGLWDWSGFLPAVKAITTASAPRSLVIGRGRTSLALSWRAPSRNGGARVTGYQWRVRSGSTWRGWVAATATSVTVSRLARHHSYAVQVRAVNAAGAGPSISGTAVTR